MKNLKRKAAAFLAAVLSVSMLLSGCYMVPVIENIFGIEITQAPTETAPTEPVTQTQRPSDGPTAVPPTESETQPTVRPSEYDDAEEQAFLAFTNGVFRDILQDAGTLTVHFYCADPESFGIDTTEVSWPPMEWGDEAEKEYKDQLDNWMKELESFEQGKLSNEGKYVYDVLKDYLTHEYDSLGFTYLYEPLSSSGVQAYLPVELAQYTIEDEQDIEEYLKLIELLPDYYASIVSYEKARSEAGFFMEDASLDEVLDQCRDMIDELKQDDSFMVTTFEKRLDALGVSAEQKTSYMERNALAIKNGMIPAYEAIVTGLEPLYGTAKYAGNLASRPDGKEYYEYLAASSTGSSRTVAEMEELLERKIREGIAKIQKLAQTSAAVLYRYEEGDIYPSQDPNLCMKILEEKIKDDFPSVEGIDYEVDYVDDSLRDYLSPAMYLLRPYGSKVADSILINCDKGDEPDDIFITLAHEGYPGHMLQTNYLLRSSKYPLRYILETSGFSEGYAEYVELRAYSYLDVPKAVQDYYSILAEVTLYLYARADIGVEYDGWDAKQTGNYMADYFDSADEMGEWMYQHIIGDPGGYLDYAIGMIEVRELYETAKSMGADDMWFHRNLLGLSGAPFSLIRKYMFE